MIQRILRKPAMYIFGLIIVAISIATYIVTFKNGSYYCFNDACGVYFWGAHSVDGLWHMAIMQHSFDTFPFTVPILSGHILKGYNYLLDLLVAPLQLLGLSPQFIYFKLLSVMWVVSMVVVLTQLSRRLNKSLTYVNNLLIFVFFGTGLYFLFALYHHGTIWETDGGGGILYLTNMQFSYSLVVMFIAMYVSLSKTLSLKKDVLLTILMFIITGFKFYTGVVFGAYLASYYVLSMINDRINWKLHFRSLLMAGLGSVIAIIIIYDPLHATGSSESVFSFAPFALANRLIEEWDRFYIESLALARYTLLEDGWGPRLIALELFTTLVYIIFEFGARILGYIALATKTVKRTLNQFDISVGIAITVGLILSLTLVQRGQWWNVIQFLYVGLVLLSFHSADAMTWLLQRRNTATNILAIFIIGTFVPFNVVASIHFSKFDSAKYIPDTELNALSALKDMDDGIVLRLPPRIHIGSQRPSPQPMWYESNVPYISVYADKVSYFDAPETLKILDIEYEDRLDIVSQGRTDVIRDNVDYVYAYGPMKSFCSPEMAIRSLGTEVYDEDDIFIYKL